MYSADSNEMGRFRLTEDEVERLPRWSVLTHSARRRKYAAVQYYGKQLVEPAAKLEEVHNAAFIGARTFDAATRLEQDVDAALKKYVDGLRTAYNFKFKEMQGSFARSISSPKASGSRLFRKYGGQARGARARRRAHRPGSIEAPGAEFTFNEGGKSDWTKGGENPFEDGTFSLRSASRATCCCVFFSVTLGLLSLVVAGLFYAEGSRLYDGEDAGQPVSHFWDGNYWGWPSEKIFRNIWCGLMLGVVFGFLDNFGLFYGTSALDGTFYSSATRSPRACSPTRPSFIVKRHPLMQNDKYTTEVAIAAHQITEDMMSGLGNTFRGPPRRHPRRAALEMRKAGLGVQALVVAGGLDRHRARLHAGRLPASRGQVQGQGRRATPCGSGCSPPSMSLIFVSVLVVGIPGDEDTRKADAPWTIWVSLGLFVVILAYLLIVVVGMPLYYYRKCAIRSSGRCSRCPTPFAGRACTAPRETMDSFREHVREVQDRSKPGQRDAAAWRCGPVTQPGVRASREGADNASGCVCVCVGRKAHA